MREPIKIARLAHAFTVQFEKSRSRRYSDAVVASVGKRVLLWALGRSDSELDRIVAETEKELEKHGMSNCPISGASGYLDVTFRQFDREAETDIGARRDR